MVQQYSHNTVYHIIKIVTGIIGSWGKFFPQSWKMFPNIKDRDYHFPTASRQSSPTTNDASCYLLFVLFYFIEKRHGCTFSYFLIASKQVNKNH